MGRNQLILGLQRPQYVALPEAFVSDLAWRAFPSDVPSLGGKPVGLRYRSEDQSKKSIAFRATAPKTSDEFLELGLSAHAAGLVGEAPASLVGRAIAESVSGLKAAKGSSQAVSPLTPGLALLQNTRGLFGVANPPNVAEIIEQIYALGAVGTGSLGGASDRSATGDWLSAARHRIKVDPLLNSIDSAVQAVLLDAPLAGERALRPADLGIALGDRTPFGWFRRSWQLLTSDEWVEALPPRTWVDWATTVLRLGYGLAFLWESAWYESIARTIIDGRSIEDMNAVLDGMDPVIPWRSARLGVGGRDVAPILVKRSYRAERIRQFLQSGLPEASEADTAVEGIRALQRDSSVRAVIQEILRTDVRTSSGKNLWEASRYALMIRSTAGGQPDYYGLLRTKGRFLTLEPGTEWVAVAASLACGRPGSMSTISDMLRDLSDMGIRPELADLISLLEEAGLARGSADADEAVLIQSAY